MIVAYPVSSIDQELALKNARWMNELGGCKGHEVLFGYDKRCYPGTVEQIQQELTRAFDKVYPMPFEAQIDGWPDGANYFFRVVTAKLQTKPQTHYFMWMEADAIPLTPGWLNAIEAEYKGCNKPFMGDRVEVGDIPLHMSGVGIYPLPLHAFAGEAYRAADTAWDMAGKDQIVPNAHFTRLIEHAWKHPRFTMLSELETQIRPEAILFHSSKDGSLIDLLRQKRKVAMAYENVQQVQREPSATQNRTRLPRIPTMQEMRAGEKETSATYAESLARPKIQGEGDAQDSSKKGQDSQAGSLLGVPQARGEAEATRTPRGLQSTTGSEMAMSGLPHRGGRDAPTCDIFIRTYPGDYEWLKYCLQSVYKFASGFRKLWIISPHANPIPPLSHSTMAVEWKQMNDESEDGYLAQQITKLYADVITDYQADYILHIDSDVILTRPVTPYSFLTAGPSLTPHESRVVWPYTPYASIETPWQDITEKFMGMTVELEFMRRFPIMIPRWLYPRLREFCHKRHGVPICDYVKMQPLRAFSEFNAMGAYAYAYHNDRFAWDNTLVMADIAPEPFAKQFHSWGGITPEIKAEIETTLRGTEASVPTKPNKVSVSKSDSSLPNSVPSQIKVLSNDVWVLKDDQISEWVEQEGRLDHDQNFLPKILPLIRPGDTVIDVGAFIGDHTIAYSEAVGDDGWVMAFEPNPIAYKCLVHNLSGTYNVSVHPNGLSDREEEVLLSGNNGNWGGAYVGDHMPIGRVKMESLDQLNYAKVDLIKIDSEGYEMKVLYGAAKTIARLKPQMVIEVNREALRRQGFTPEHIFRWLKDAGYSYEIMQENCCADSPMYDILCSYNHKSPEVPERMKGEGGFTRCSSQPPPVRSPMTPFGEMIAAVTLLQNFAAIDSSHRHRVMTNLAKAGLTPRWKPKKKQRDKIRNDILQTDSPQTAKATAQPTGNKEGKRAG